MKIKYAREKSLYSTHLMRVINPNLSELDREESLVRMTEIETFLKSEGDEIKIIITTKNTNPIKDKSAPPMDIK